MRDLDHPHEDEIAPAVRGCGPLPLPLDGWDQASVWGWDETTGSLYAHLWRNTDDPAAPPTVRIEPDDYTPTITCDTTFAQHIAMVTECSPWRALWILLDTAGLNDENEAPANSHGGPVATMTEGYSRPEWPYGPQS